MIQHILTSWRAGVRSHSFRVVAFIALMLIVAAHVASLFSGRHPATVALDVAISGARIVLVLLAVFWVYELIGKELERKTVYFSLAYPVPRYSFWLGRFFGISMMLLASIALLAVAIMLMTHFAGSGYRQVFALHWNFQYVLLWLAVAVDVMSITAFVILVSSIATTPLLPIVTGLVFAFVARSYSTVVAVMSDKNSETADMAANYLPVLKKIGYFLPDLGALDLRQLVLYGESLNKAEVGMVLGQTLLYTVILIFLSAVVFSRRELN